MIPAGPGPVHRGGLYVPTTGFKLAAGTSFIALASALVLVESADGFPRQPDRTQALHAFRANPGVVQPGAPQALLRWKSTVPDTTDEAWPKYDKAPDIHRFRPGFATRGQPWLTSYRYVKPVIEAETYTPTSIPQTPLYGRTAAVATAGAPWPLWQAPPRWIEPDPDRPVINLYALHQYRTGYQTVGQPWAASYRYAKPTVEAETYQPANAPPLIHSYRVGYQTVGQPWRALYQTNRPLVEAESYTPPSPATLYRQTVTAATQSSPWLLWQSSTRWQEIDPPQPAVDLYGLHRYRTGYQTVGQPWPQWQQPAVRIEPETYTVTLPDQSIFFWRTPTVAAAAQPWNVYQWQSPVPDTSELTIWRSRDFWADYLPFTITPVPGPTPQPQFGGGGGWGTFEFGKKKRLPEHGPDAAELARRAMPEIPPALTDIGNDDEEALILLLQTGQMMIEKPTIAPNPLDDDDAEALVLLL
jgi:hypothetical protein